MAQFDCRGCTERYVGCHADCERYKKQKAALDDRKKATREDFIKQDLALSYTIKDIQRKKRKARKK